jgi:hypothetical protein
MKRTTHKKYGKKKDWHFELYHDSRDFDYSCRHGGSCDRCSEGRQYKFKLAKQISVEKLISFLEGELDYE